MLLLFIKILKFIGMYILIKWNIYIDEWRFFKTYFLFLEEFFYDIVEIMLIFFY